MIVLVLNPGSNSLKFDVIEAAQGQQMPSAGKRLSAGSVENIGKDADLVIANKHTRVTRNRMQRLPVMR
jgi:acetate kinase